METNLPRRESTGKRPRSPTNGDYTQIASKLPKTMSNHLQINYLARQYSENLPLASTDDTLPALLHLIGEYDGVLHRHESIAGNLGACTLGPILIKRFERLFEAPPKVLKTNGKECSAVSWLDVVEFAKTKPEQFVLEKTRDGMRVCQIYVKQCRVEISEEDFVLIASGMPQKMIPPQPISEDEEKELGALEILEKNLGNIIQLADQVSARARQLNHRLKNRRNAIVSRRENDATLNSQAQRAISPWKDSNGNNNTYNHMGNGHSRPHSPTSGFVAVNSRPEPFDDSIVIPGAQFTFSQPISDNVTIINGTSIKGASPTTRAELMKRFFSTSDRRIYNPDEESAAAPPQERDRQNSRSRPRVSDPGDYTGPYAPVPIPNTPSSLLPQAKPINHYERDDGGPFKIEMVSRMEDLQRGDRILPPCDRCRRLHMECLKNLTACMGCTKKHAKCSWKDVKLEELREIYPNLNSNSRKEKDGTHNSSNHASSSHSNINNNINNINNIGNNSTVPHAGVSEIAPPSTSPSPTEPHTASTTHSEPHSSHPQPPYAMRNDNLEHRPPLITRPASEPHHQTRLCSPPPRSHSDNILPGNATNDTRRVNGNTRVRDVREIRDQDVNDVLTQAIMDTVDQHRARAAAAAVVAERDKGEVVPVEAR
ncbi:hypothetical protein FQN57_001775 [Myotisia sp. PD_48]|nr:hypothetical protein FQN57_001775 [Myotisia sp. PD_48]